MTAAAHPDHGDGAQPQLAELSRANRITIPDAVVEAAGVRPGDKFRVEVVGEGEFRLVRTRDRFWEAFNELAGSMPGLSEETNLEELRNEWER